MPGFMPKLKGLLTTQRYNYATIFVDQYSKLSFVFLQKRITSAENVLAKQSFECFARDHGVKILHYLADSGRFADNGFIQACKDNNQCINIAESMHIFKMASQKREFGTNRNRPERCFSLWCTSGLECYLWH